jgi:Na+/proline symporter
MSDISFQFTWLDLLFFALLIGSPGLLLGVVLGAVAWRRHRICGAALGAILGLGVWIGLRFVWR